MLGPELTKLLISELSRHLEAMRAEGATRAVRLSALTSTRSSVAMAGERELEGALLRLERLARGGDDGALDEAVQLVAQAIGALERGEPLALPSWPQLPPGLRGARSAEGEASQLYVDEMRQRFLRIDEALVAERPSPEAAGSVLRELHTVKGAAASVGDETMAWYTHGLESSLKRTLSEGDVGRALAEVRAHRPLLSELLVDPQRAMSRLSSSSPSPGVPRARPTPKAAVVGDDADGRAFLRVPGKALDRLSHEVEHLLTVGADLSLSAQRARETADVLRRVEASLGNALRLIGPPKPWGTPAAAIARVREALDEARAGGDRLSIATSSLRDEARDLRGSLRSLLQASRRLGRGKVGSLFERVKAALLAEASRSATPVSVESIGDELPLDRILLDQLFEPLLHLARNAIAHGGAHPEERLARGKPRAMRVRLEARREGRRVLIIVSDDGEGVDIDAVRARAVEMGVLGVAEASEASDERLLDTLFLPGFSTRDVPDHLAGRGLGLDAALYAVERASGTMILTSQRGCGVSVLIDLPLDSGAVTALWVREGERWFALASHEVAVVRATVESEVSPALGSLLSSSAPQRSKGQFTVEVSGDGERRVVFSVDEIGELEEVEVRPLPATVLAHGPYRGAVVRARGSLSLLLNVQAL